MHSTSSRDSGKVVLNFHIDLPMEGGVRAEILAGSQYAAGRIIDEHLSRLHQELQKNIADASLLKTVQDSPAFKLFTGDIFEFVKNSIDAGATEFSAQISIAPDSVEIDLKDNGLNKGLAEKLGDHGSIDYSEVLDERGRVASSEPNAKKSGGEGRGLGEASHYLKVAEHKGSLQLIRDEKDRVFIRIQSPQVVGKDFATFQIESQMTPAAPKTPPPTLGAMGGLFAKRMAAAKASAASSTPADTQHPTPKVSPRDKSG